MGLGKTYKDFENDFSCDTLAEWNEHLGTVTKTYVGNSECVTCGDRVEFEWTGKLKNGKGYPDILCEVCKAQ